LAHTHGSNTFASKHWPQCLKSMRLLSGVPVVFWPPSHLDGSPLAAFCREASNLCPAPPGTRASDCSQPSISLAQWEPCAMLAWTPGLCCAGALSRGGAKTQSDISVPLKFFLWVTASPPPHLHTGSSDNLLINTDQVHY
jgi:hypothetical protein